ncbi:DUF2283 domain-containing protein [Candidatus Borrarchaeum sp.]|uniref:DUF2283 domain-containing protein n=1 Tax=Candidatus Borrarchaeum sp. TaxID=2846742 RepID=UPI00257B5610|nr:DUF2283 domain-containing protein [Candidatus Borrarchaeum sp.]
METIIENIEKVDVSYDKERDVLYISFGHSQPADDSELTDKDIIIRYKDNKVIGLSVLSFSKRLQH